MAMAHGHSGFFEHFCRIQVWSKKSKKSNLAPGKLFNAQFRKSLGSGTRKIDTNKQHQTQYKVMEHRIREIIETYNLQSHPEGGYYAETYRSQEEVNTQKGSRNLITAIYFLLTNEDVSRFHVIASDELWFHHEGDDVIVHVLDEDGHHQLKLGKQSQTSRPQHLVPKGKIFGSCLEGSKGYALVSCVVAPGFDFQDFKLLSKAELLQSHPNHHEIIDRLGC